MTELGKRLEALAEPRDGNWLDVVARAERHRSRTLRRGLLIAVAVVLLVVPAIAVATGRWQLFSLSATDEEVPLPEGEAKLGYVVGDEVHLPGRRPATLAAPVGAYLSSEYPLVVPSTDGRTLVYHTWVWELDQRRGVLKRATTFLRVFGVDTGTDTSSCVAALTARQSAGRRRKPPGSRLPGQGASCSRNRRSPA